MVLNLLKHGTHGTSIYWIDGLKIAIYQLVFEWLNKYHFSPFFDISKSQDRCITYNNNKGLVGILGHFTSQRRDMKTLLQKTSLEASIPMWVFWYSKNKNHIIVLFIISQITKLFAFIYFILNKLHLLLSSSRSQICFTSFKGLECLLHFLEITQRSSQFS